MPTDQNPLLAAATRRKATAPVTPAATSSSSRPPSRQRKVQIAAFFSPQVRRQLRQIALDRETTLQALFAEALDDLFVKYRQPEIAKMGE